MTEDLATHPLELGERLHLQLAEPGGRACGTIELIGQLPGRSIIGVPVDRQGLSVSVHEGDELLARRFSGAAANGFRCRVLCVSHRPYPHMHLSFPEAVVRMSVRAAPRARMNLPAEVLKADRSLGEVARIRDLSVTGALVAATRLLGQPGDALGLRLHLPGEDEGTALLLTAVIRNSYETDARGTHPFSCGVEFDDVDPQAMLLLRAFLAGLGEPVAAAPVGLPAADDGRLRWMLRRGMKELDVLTERYQAKRYAQAPPAERAAFMRLLNEVEDPDLWAWVMGKAEVPPEFADVVEQLRRHD